MVDLSDDILLLIFSYVEDPRICEAVCTRWKNLILKEPNNIYYNACKRNGWHCNASVDSKSEESKADTNIWRDLFIKEQRTKRKLTKLFGEFVDTFKKYSPDSTYCFNSDAKIFSEVEESKYKRRLPNDVKEFFKLYDGTGLPPTDDDELRKWIPYSLNKNITDFVDPIDDDIDMFADEVLSGETPNNKPIILGEPSGGEDYGESVWCDVDTGKLWYVTLNIPEYLPIGDIETYLSESIQQLKKKI